MRYAITGVTGFVGGHLAVSLRARGHDVVALARNPRAVEADDRLAGVEVVAGDLEDASALDRLLHDADGLFHVAGWYKLGARDPGEGRRVNVGGTRAVLQAARRAGTARIVYTSTLAVNSDTRGAVRDETHSYYTGRHLSVYDATKAEAHRVAERFSAEGLPVIIAMPGAVYGPGDTSQAGRLVADVVAGRRVAVPSSSRLCWGFVDDVVRGHVLAMGSGTPGQAYMLAGPQHTLAEVLRLAATLSGGRPPTTLPRGVVLGLAGVAEVVQRLVPLPPEYQAESLRSACATYLGSPAKAERELAWSARPLADGMAVTVRALRAAAAP